jgi:hypothetical protein
MLILGYMPHCRKPLAWRRSMGNPKQAVVFHKEFNAVRLIKFISAVVWLRLDVHSNHIKPCQLIAASRAAGSAVYVDQGFTIVRKIKH